MKNLFYLIFSITLCLLSACVNNKEKEVSDSCTIHVKVDGNSTGELIIAPYQSITSIEVYDSLKIVSPINKKTNTLKIDTVKALRRLTLNYNKKTYRTKIFTAPGTYTLTLKDDSIHVDGTSTHNEYLKLDMLLEGDKMERIRYKRELTKEESLFKKNYSKSLIEGIKKYPKSSPLAQLVYNQFWMTDLDTINTIINSFDKDLQSSYFLKQLIERKNNLERVAIGKKSPAFSLPTYHNKIISLNDFKGKYVLIDFWASWCPPCIKGIPNLKRIRKRFPEESLSIISISIDAKKDDWIKAVQKHEMPWPQLLDESPKVADMFAVTAIPHLVIISPSGKIVYKTTGEDEHLEMVIDNFINSKNK
ncbi:TlpA family protein disulfide reductase [Flavivirga eckloniae]|uniref:Thioredoxin domain-containing protein n=1 Tax=Flavivirga eckloniae TaxID=1803846 RepID=A0A2K9PUE5_9FLAO|nr:TlpA disulfide reductase family protein [Flavivirga eckloniae]AUP80682.1 hypothetical protein C1H87_18970 [Flavivirga eckloniae]